MICSLLICSIWYSFLSFARCFSSYARSMVNVISFYNTKFKMEGDSLVESVNLLLKQLCHKSNHRHLKSPLSPTGSFLLASNHWCKPNYSSRQVVFVAMKNKTGDMKCLLERLSILTSVLIRLWHKSIFLSLSGSLTPTITLAWSTISYACLSRVCNATSNSISLHYWVFALKKSSLFKGKICVSRRNYNDSCY